MKPVKVSEFKSQLAYYLRLVQNGEELEILDRGKPIAKVSRNDSVPLLFSIKPKKNIKTFKDIKFKPVNLLDSTFDVNDFLMKDRRGD